MRDMLGTGSVDPAEPQVGRIAGNRDHSRAGWTDTAVTDAKRRQDRPARRTPTAVSGVWLFLLSSLARRNGPLSFRFRQRR